MARKAVAATLASLVLFTALVVADSTVMAAQDNLASSALSSKVESREALLAQYSAGTAALEALVQVQDYLSSNPADCADMSGYLGSVSASASVSGVDSGIAYASRINATGADLFQVFQPDNLTAAAPFSGYLPGALNLRAALGVKEVGGGGSVSLERHELHTLHLAISPQSASSLCSYILSSLAATLSGRACNATRAQAAFVSATPSLSEVAAARGFFLAAGWGPGAGCTATYWIILVELGVEGVTGSFDWTVRGSGSTA